MVIQAMILDQEAHCGSGGVLLVDLPAGGSVTVNLCIVGAPNVVVDDGHAKLFHFRFAQFELSGLNDHVGQKQHPRTVELVVIGILPLSCSIQRRNHLLAFVVFLQIFELFERAGADQVLLAYLERCARKDDDLLSLVVEECGHDVCLTRLGSDDPCVVPIAVHAGEEGRVDIQRPAECLLVRRTAFGLALVDGDHIRVDGKDRGGFFFLLITLS